MLHGYETGIIRQLPNGGFIEVHQPLDEEAQAVLEAKKVRAAARADAPRGANGAEERNGVPAPGTGGPLGRARAIANRAFAETIVIEATGTGTGMATGTCLLARSTPPWAAGTRSCPPAATAATTRSRSPATPSGRFSSGPFRRRGRDGGGGGSLRRARP